MPIDELEPCRVNLQMEQAISPSDFQIAPKA
jgi:hypothetical protein